MTHTLGRFELNKVYSGDCALLMSELPPSSIDLTVTSPPYDNLRDYHGYTFDFKSIAFELFRVTKPGGVVVWVVGDATVNGSETGTSFRQALHFMELGFNLHDTMIYQTDKQPQNGNRYEPKFEYMFILSQCKPTTFNPIREPAIYAGKKSSPITYNVDGTKKEWWGDGVVKDMKVLGNVWYIPSGKGKSTTDKIEHPAMLPEALARDHIISWSNPGDIVLDPMCGSGTTLKMAKQSGRQFLGFDVSVAYCEIARKRIKGAQTPLFLLDAGNLTLNEPDVLRTGQTGAINQPSLFGEDGA